jgi:hypothetical protein
MFVASSARPPVSDHEITALFREMEQSHHRNDLEESGMLVCGIG